MHCCRKSTVNSPLLTATGNKKMTCRSCHRPVMSLTAGSQDPRVLRGRVFTQ